MSKRFLIEFSKGKNDNPNLDESSFSVKGSDYQSKSFKPKKRGSKSKSTDSKEKEEYLLLSENEADKSPWDEAHELMDHFFEKGAPIDFVEPDKESLLFESKTSQKKSKEDKSTYSDDWFLKKEFSQLKKARTKAKKYFSEDLKQVKIGHICNQKLSLKNALLPEIESIPLENSDTSSFVKAVEHAVNVGCEVIAVSFAGLPSAKWASIINRAYENGITVVGKGYTKQFYSYPAHWERVIAAIGVSEVDLTSNFENFSKNETSDSLQNAITGYNSDSGYPPVLQIAEAAALWIQRFRKEIDKAKISGTWKQVEAIRQVLMKSAELSDFEQAGKYLGNGYLKAAEALKKKYFPKKSELKKAPPAQVLIPTFKVFFGGRRGVPVHEGKLEMYSTELFQIAAETPELQELLTANLSFADVEKRQNIPAQEQFMEWRFALRDVGASDSLLQFMGLKGGRGMGRRL